MINNREIYKAQKEIEEIKKNGGNANLENYYDKNQIDNKMDGIVSKEDAKINGPLTVGGEAELFGQLFLNSPDNIEAKAPFTTAVISNTRGGVKCLETWILINAYYDYTSRKFKRINLDNFSFGWQFQAGGTYPGEENFGDYINQGVNLWKANGRNAYYTDEEKAKVTEDIGMMIEGKWVEFGIMYGWTNHFMNDSYGGMTVGGAGFEVDGNGMFPYIRVSLGKFGGGSNSNLANNEYVYGYNGRLWNSFHGMFDSDDKNQDSLFYGFAAPIDYKHEDGSANEGSNKCDLSKTKFQIKHLPPNSGFCYESWRDIFSLDLDGNIIIDPRKGSSPYLFNAQIINNTDYQITWPTGEGWTSENGKPLKARATRHDGKVDEFPVSGSVSSTGIYGWLGLDPNGEPYSKAIIFVTKIGEILNDGSISLINASCSKGLKITKDGQIITTDNARILDEKDLIGIESLKEEIKSLKEEIKMLKDLRK